MPENVVIAAPSIVPPTYLSFDIATTIAQRFEDGGLQVRFLGGPLASRPSFILAMQDPEIDLIMYLGHGTPTALCIHPESSLLLKNGTIQASELQENDEILTHKGRMRKVTKRFSRYYNGEIYKIKVVGCNEPLLLTPEHPVLVLTENGNETFLQAKNLKKGMRLAYPRITTTHTLEKMSIMELLEGDYFAYSEENIIWAIKKHEGTQQYTTSPMPRFLDINKYLMRLFGYYIAEGHSTKDTTIGFSFNSNEETYLSDVETLMQTIFQWGGYRTEKEYSDCTQLMFSNKQLSIIFKKLFGDNAREKHIPEWFLDLEPELLKSLIIGYWRGDGTYDWKRRTIRFGTVSRQLAFGIKNILAKLGISCNIHKYPPNAKTIQGREVNFAEWTYDIQCGGAHADNLADILGITLRKRKGHSGWRESTISRNYIHSGILGIETFHYEGEVLNFEIEEDNTYVLTAGVVHNCMEDPFCRLGFNVEDVGWLAGKILCAAPACEVGKIFAPKMIEVGGKAALASIEPMFAAFPEAEHDYLSDWHDYTIAMYSTLMTETVEDAYRVYQNKCTRYIELYKSKIGEWPNCIPQGTLIDTPQGMRKIESISPLDRIIGSDSSLRVKRVFKRKYSGPLIKIKGSSLLPIITTPEHPVLSSTKLSKPKWVEARNLTKNHFLVTNKIPPSYNTSVPALIRKPKTRNKRRMHLLNPSMDKDLFRFFGRYVGDGCSSNDEVILSFNSKEEDDIQRFSNIFEKSLGYSACKIESKNCASTNLRIHSRIGLGKKLKYFFGNDCYSKKIPEFVMNSPKEMSREFLLGLLNSDGCELPKEYRITTTSKTLATQTQRLSSKFGYLPYVREVWTPEHAFESSIPHKKYEIGFSRRGATKVFGFEHDIINRGTRWKFSNERFHSPITLIEEVHYNGSVYNLDTEGDSTFCINNIVVHNCDWYIQSTTRNRDDFMLFGDPYARIEYTPSKRERNIIEEVLSLILKR